MSSDLFRYGCFYDVWLTVIIRKDDGGVSLAWDNIASSFVDLSLYIAFRHVSSLPTILEAVYTILSSLLHWRWLMPSNHTHIEHARIHLIAELYNWTRISLLSPNSFSWRRKNNLCWPYSRQHICYFPNPVTRYHCS